MSSINAHYARSQLTRLFNADEAVCVADHERGYQVFSLASVLAHMDDGAAPWNFVCLNPLNGSQDLFPVEEWHASHRPRRADANVTAHRNLLIEFDGIPLDEQAKKLVDLDVPYTSLVYSGGKSLHAVIALKESVSRSEYDELWKLTKTVLWQSDPTAKNPSRLTRLAGAIRHDGGGAVQELVDLRNRISKDRLIRWLSRFSSHIERCRAREQEAQAAQAAQLAALRAKGAIGLGAVEERTRAFLRGEGNPPNSRHARLVAACFELFEAGVEYEEALELATTAADVWGITSEPRRLREAEQVVNYVYSVRRAFSRR